MSYLVALPEAMAAAATDVVSIGSVVTTAGQGAAEATAGVLAAAEDEVSAAIAALFSAHGQSYQALSSEVAAFQEQFAQTLSCAAGAFAAAEAASAAPLAAFEQIPARIVAGVNSAIDYLTVTAGFPVYSLLSSDIPPLSWVFSNSPPPLLNSLLGQTVEYSTFEGMRVVQITPARPTGEYVVALHGGAYVVPATIGHWFYYSLTAYQTGATFQVPIYPLVQEGGTAGTVVPKVANFISSQIVTHGVQNVSVTGDSAGGNLALAAVQHLVSQGAPVPASMVLLSPWLDVRYGEFVGKLWGGDLSVTNPMVSPLYGSLAGLPPTYVYSGLLDPLAQQAAVLQRAAAAQGAPLRFITDIGIHDWILIPGWGSPYWPQINQQLGIAA